MKAYQIPSEKRLLMHVFLVDDNEQQTELMSLWLEIEGISCTCFYDGASLIEALILTPEKPNLIILDWNLPDIQGDLLLKKIRHQIDSTTPIVFVSARADKSDIVLALENGANDYIVKPADRKEWIARIKLQLNGPHYYSPTKHIIKEGNIVINIQSQSIVVSNKTINITPKEFAVALALFNNIGNIVSREDLMSNVWGYSDSINTRTVDTHISRVKKKLGLTSENHWSLNSVYNFGYRLERKELVH